ncbi:MAG: alpha/beta hydrolase [Ruminococcaceae bacterium]|nr:alpha/beta hydrolase [Oscillospiraceae bacterium]
MRVTVLSVAGPLSVFLLIAVSLFIVWMLVALWAMKTAIGKRPDRPLEVIEKDPNTAWHRFNKEIHEGVDRIDAMPKTEIYTKAHDGITLGGILIEHPSPRATLIMFHGYRSAGENDFSCAASFYHSLGFNLLIVDQRTHARSGGKYIGFGVLERHDCKAWVWEIHKRYSKDLPIIITGVSMGASTVLMAGELDMPENLIAIIADCGFTSPKEIIASVIKKRYHIPPQIIMPGMNVWAKLLAKYSFDEISTCDTLKNVKVPVLFIHGRADDFVPCYMTERAFEACVTEKEVIYVENAGHGESYLTERERCESTLKAFVERQLEKFRSAL